MIPPCLSELPQPPANIWHATNPFLERTALYSRRLTQAGDTSTTPINHHLLAQSGSSKGNFPIDLTHYDDDDSSSDDSSQEDEDKSDDEEELDEDSEEYQKLVDDTLNDRKSEDPSSLPVTHSTFITWLSSINVINAKKDWNWDGYTKSIIPTLSARRIMSRCSAQESPPFLLRNTDGTPRFRNSLWF